MAFFSSSSSIKFSDAPTIVYWDTVDCPIPEGLDAETVVENIRTGLFESGYRILEKIKAYGDVFEMVRDSGGFATVGLPMCHVPAETKGACRKAIMIDSLYEAIGQRRPLNLLLILGDISGSLVFKQTFCFMQNRANLNFLLAQPDVSSTSKWKFEPVKTVWIWSSLIQGEGPLEDQDEPLTPAQSEERYLAYREFYGLDSESEFCSLDSDSDSESV